jgi:hypothetical protein
VAAEDLTALSRNYFDQIHFAINHLAMLPGFFLTKMCGAGKAIAMYMTAFRVLNELPLNSTVKRAAPLFIQIENPEINIVLAIMSQQLI